MKGILLVDKPSGMTSHDVVDRVRRAARQRRVGHTGTLDPSATGLLVLCLGVATRLSEFLTGMDKVYEGAMRLGVETDSYDLDGDVVAERPVPEDIDRARLEALFARFTGELMQVPPMVSAVKVGGQRLYKRARRGETVEREPRRVVVHRFELLSLDPPDVRFRVRCSRGTYARSLAHDAGQELGCGAALADLRRTAVGRHRIEEAVPLEALDAPEAVERHLRPMDAALDLPEVHVADDALARVSQGNALLSSDLVAACPVEEGWVQIKAASGQLLAVGRAEAGPRGELRVQPKRVLSA